MQSKGESEVGALAEATARVKVRSTGLWGSCCAHNGFFRPVRRILKSAAHIPIGVPAYEFLIMKLLFAVDMLLLLLIIIIIILVLVLLGGRRCRL
jgi:hypothetical protein